jgi:hypothetical protein
MCYGYCKTCNCDSNYALACLPQKCRVGSIGAYVLSDRFPAPSLRTVRTPLGVYGSLQIFNVSFDTLQNFGCWIIEVFLPFIVPFLKYTCCQPSPCKRRYRFRFYGNPCRFRVLELLCWLRCHPDVVSPEKAITSYHCS